MHPHLISANPNTTVGQDLCKTCIAGDNLCKVKWWYPIAESQMHPKKATVCVCGCVHRAFLAPGCGSHSDTGPVKCLSLLSFNGRGLGVGEGCGDGLGVKGWRGGGSSAAQACSPLGKKDGSLPLNHRTCNSAGCRAGELFTQIGSS